MMCPDNAPVRVVVVASQPEVREPLAALLRREGYEPVEVSSGSEALRLIERGDLALFLPDPMAHHPAGSSFKEIVRRRTMEIERAVLDQVLKLTGGNKAKAARILRIDYKTIHTKAKEYGLSGKKGDDEPSPAG